MKKFFLFALAAAFAFTSCTKDETLATAQPGAIDFAVAANNSTRSCVDPSITTANIQDFAVYGWMQSVSIVDSTTIGGEVFDNEVVHGGNGNWSYDNTQYWAKNRYYFAALAPAFYLDSAKRNWSLTQGGIYADKGIGDVHFENRDGKQDLLYWADILDNTKGAVEDKKVQVVFNHLLSKVKFSFENAFTNELTTIRVSDVKITNAYERGDINLNVEDWWTDPDNWDCSGAQPFEFGNVTNDTTNGLAQDIAVGDQMESHKEVLLFPAADKTYDIEFTVTVLNGEAIAGVYEHKVQLTTTFKMGYSYDLKATLTAANVNPAEELKPIEFEVTVKDWMQEGTGEVEVPVTEDHENVTIEAGATMNLGCNGTIKGSMTVAGTLNGNDHILFADAEPTNPVLIKSKGNATIKNLTINGSNRRAVLADGTTKPLYGIMPSFEGGVCTIENVTVLGCTYALNVGGYDNPTTGVELYVSNSTLEGWTSFGEKVIKAEFNKVNFTKGKYANFKPYTSVTLTECTFEEGFMIDFTKLDGVITFKNCKYGEKTITSVADLVTVDGDPTGKVAF